MNHISLYGNIFVFGNLAVIKGAPYTMQYLVVVVVVVVVVIVVAFVFVFPAVAYLYSMGYWSKVLPALYCN
jgi:hypothetical protein